MAISYPLAMPTCATKAVDGTEMPLRAGTSSGMTRGGAVQSVQHSEPYFELTQVTRPLTRAEKAELEGWWDSMRGGVGDFLAYHPFRQWPSGYATEADVLALTRAGGGAFDGTFEVTALGSDGVSIQSGSSATTRCPPSLVITRGDMIGLSDTGVYSLHRVIKSVTATASGVFSNAGSNSIEVLPYVTPGLFTAGVGSGLIASLIRPLGRFVPDQDKWNCPSTVVPSGVTFGGRSRAG